MSVTTIAAVMRAGVYSPNNIGNDAAILNAAVDQLRLRGCAVNIYSEDQFLESEIQEGCVLNMCRRQQSIEKLQALEESGKVIVNSGFGIENCMRERMTRLLLANNIPYPESLIVGTDENIIPQMEQRNMTAVWIKRGDFHAMHKEDVSYCRHSQEAHDVLHEYFYRGIKRAVINRHLPGDLIKFYAVRNQPFFYWFYPFDEGHSKYGMEAINGKSQQLPFDVEKLMDICNQAAEILEVDIYGGDCIVSADGSIYIIDFNDWPSFAPCRDEAAPYIAKHVLNIIKMQNR